MNARFYLPELGRFMQHDPLSSTTLEPYGYGYNNPVLFADPTGLDPIDPKCPPDCIGSLASPIQLPEYGVPPPPGGSSNYYTWWYLENYYNISGGDNSGYGSSYYGGGGSSKKKEPSEDRKPTELPTVYLTGKKKSNVGRSLSNAFFTANTAVGTISTANIPGTGVFKYNEVWHQTKTRGTSYVWKKKWKNPGANYWRGQQIKPYQSARNLGNHLTKAGGVLLVADIAMSGQIKTSHLINAGMLTISTTGIGSIIAGAWFIVDMGVGGINYLNGDGFRTLSDIIDDSTGGSLIDMYNGVY